MLSVIHARTNERWCSRTPCIPPWLRHFQSIMAVCLHALAGDGRLCVCGRFWEASKASHVFWKLSLLLFWGGWWGDTARQYSRSAEVRRVPFLSPFLNTCALRDQKVGGNNSCSPQDSYKNRESDGSGKSHNCHLHTQPPLQRKDARWQGQRLAKEDLDWWRYSLTWPLTCPRLPSCHGSTALSSRNTYAE